MSGLAIVIPRAGLGPVVDPEDLLLVNGSLFLADPAHSANPWASGIPADGAILPNLAWSQAAAVLGSGDETSLKAVFDIEAAFVATDSTKRGAAERTSKGGLHIAVSQASALGQYDGAHLRPPQAIRDYFAANPTHQYFVSFWGQFTRADSTSGSTHAEIVGLGMVTNGSNNIALYRASTGWTGTVVSGSQVVNDNNVAAPCRVNASCTKTGTPASGGRVSWGAGATAAQFSTYNRALYATFNNHWPSFVFYRLYIEDQTVSGRSYDTISSLDAAAFTEAFGDGGRYENDSWTSPATLCA